MVLITRIPKSLAYLVFLFSAFFIIAGATVTNFFYYEPESPKKLLSTIEEFDADNDGPPPTSTT